MLKLRIALFPTMLTLIISLSENVGYAQNASKRNVAVQQTSTTGDEIPALYIARVISVSRATRDDFFNCLQQNELPVWRQLKRDGLLADESVFEVTSVQTTERGVPSWEVLLLTHLAPTAKQDSFVQAEKKRLRTPRCEDAPGAETRRVEVLRSTPKSYYPRATSEEDRQALQAKVEFFIEYIAVNGTPTALNQYRESMRVNMGPAMGLLIPDKWFFNLIALETVSVLYAQPGMANWNQIHIRGYFPEKGPTPTAIDAALRRVNPSGGGSAGFFGSLESIRTLRREDITHQLFDLTVR